jgi:hypothetical protein
MTDNPNQPENKDGAQATAQSPDSSNSKDGGEAAQDNSQLSPIDEARKILAETKTTLAAMQEERKKIEKAAADILVSGKGFKLPDQKKEETPEEYRKRVVGY